MGAMLPNGFIKVKTGMVFAKSKQPKRFPFAAHKQTTVTIQTLSEVDDRLFSRDQCVSRAPGLISLGTVRLATSMSPLAARVVTRMTVLMTVVKVVAMIGGQKMRL
jgi:hypothetical protein